MLDLLLLSACYQEDVDYSDDEDNSWKVRRASVRCLSALISTSQLDSLKSIYEKAATKLIERIREREENVQKDIFSCLVCLISQTVSLSTTTTENLTSSHMESERTGNEGVMALRERIPDIVRHSIKLFKNKNASIRSKQGIIVVLYELAKSFPELIKSEIPALISTMEFVLTTGGVPSGMRMSDTGMGASSSALKVTALGFTKISLSIAASDDVREPASRLLEPLVSAINEKYFKVRKPAELRNYI